MGVLNCSRKDCQQVMCSIYVDDVGYVCYDCREEFEEHMKSIGITITTEGDFKEQLDKFIDTRKGKFKKGKALDLQEFFRLHSRD